MIKQKSLKPSCISLEFNWRENVVLTFVLSHSHHGKLLSIVVEIPDELISEKYYYPIRISVVSYISLKRERQREVREGKRDGSSD